MLQIRPQLTLVAFVIGLVDVWQSNADLNFGISNEYCQLETFHPHCLKNEVIVIDRAVYGRHRVGKCLSAVESSFSQDIQFFGCFSNVTAQLDVKCSGKSTCEVRIPDADLEKTRTCLPGLHMFLEVNYRCLEESERSCTAHVSSKRLHVTGSQPANGSPRCGTRSQPWLLEAPAGQRISVTLFDFTPTVVSTGGGLTTDASARYSAYETPKAGRINACTQQQRLYGYIIDKSAAEPKKNVSVCGDTSGSRRLSHVYLSTSNVIEMMLLNTEGPSTGSQLNILVGFEAVGCTNLVPPDDAWVRRDGDKAVIGCYMSRQTWQLRCHDGKWIGVVSNCNDRINNSEPVGVLASKNDGGPLDRFEVPAVVAIVFAGLAACLIIVCCGIVCLHRFYSRSSKKVCETSDAYHTTVCHPAYNHQDGSTAVEKFVLLKSENNRDILAQNSASR